MGENRQSITMVMKEEYDELQALYEQSTRSLMDRYIEIRDLTDANAALQARYDALEAQLKDIKQTTRDECAVLIDELAKDGRWTEHKWARLALKSAAATVLRGRILTIPERFVSIFLGGAA